MPKFKKILITGGAGFIGSNFVRYLLRKTKGEKQKIKIVNLDKLTYSGNLANLKDIEKDERYRFVKGDICDKKCVSELTKDMDVIINFAAESHVDRSIKNPEVFIKTNVFGTQVLLEAAKEHKLKRFVQISCYDEKTRALTIEGLKTYKQLKEGDKVFSLNPKTFEIEIKPIEKVIIQPYKGRLIHFNNKRINLCVTPNHNMFIMDTTNKKLLVETAEKVSKRSIFYMPSGYWRGENKEYFSVGGHGKVKTKDLLYILGIFIGDGFTAYQEKKVETKTGLPRSAYLNKAKDKNTGRFKKIEKQNDYTATCRSHRVFFDIPENDKCRKTVEKTLNKLNIKYHSHKGKSGTHLYFTSKPFMELLDQCGKGAHNKHIPRWALEYSPEYLKYLLQGLIDSDGYQTRTNKLYFTVSKKLVSDVCELCIKLKLKPSVFNKRSKSYIGKRRIEGHSYYVFIANTTKSISRHRIKTVDYNGDIWCLKVRDNKNFLVERNGKFDFCGNTDEVYGSITKGHFSEESTLAPNSPYAASKAAADLLVRSYFVTHKLPAIITRSSNNFGPYQYPEKVIPLFITNALENKKVPLYADGSNVREWLYVEDNCSAIDFILNFGKDGEIYNIGSENEMRNIDLTKMVLKILGKDEKLIKFVKDRPGHDKRYALTLRKLKELGWEPQYKFKDALEATVLWYKENVKWWKRLKTRKEKFW